MSNIWYKLKKLFTILSFALLASCNLKTAQQDIQHSTQQASRYVGDKTRAAQESFDRTFDKEKEDLIDPSAGLSRKGYREALQRPRAPTIQDKPPNPILPDVSQLMIAPRPPVIGKDKLVTLAVTEDVPLKEVLIELARRADVDIEVDPGIKGGVIFRAKDRPFSEVIDRIADLTGLRYSVRNGVLRVERDLPHVVNYQVDVLNIIRSNTGAVNITTNVLSSAAQSGGGGLTTGSTNALSSSYEGNVWEEIRLGVEGIIKNYTGIVPTFQNRAGDAATDDVLGAAPAGGNSQGGAGDNSAVLSINKQSGIISVLASDRQHRQVKNYLDQIQQSQSAQVLIEAKVVEVELNDEYRAGINWNIGNAATGSQFVNSSLVTPEGITTAPGSTFRVGVAGELFGINELDIDAAVELLEQFGVTRTLSSPRINATNNQQAVLSFARNEVYFEVSVTDDTTTDTTATTTERTRLTVESTPKTVPIGVILTLQPKIDMDKGEVVLNVRPTLSKLIRTVSDPGVALTVSRLTDANGDPIDANAIKSEVPIVQVRELDSILRIKSGQVMVIGGLMEETNQNIDTGVPGLQEIPFIGRAFKSVQKTSGVTETVIFIKATIVPPYGVGREDKDIERTFGSGRRAMTF